jgi:hypothetical protein
MHVAGSHNRRRNTARIVLSISTRVGFALALLAVVAATQATAQQPVLDAEAVSGAPSMGAALSGGQPTIESLSVSHITSKRATLEATIAPNGLETTYEFWVEYGCGTPPPNHGACLWIDTVKPGEGQIAAGTSGQGVSAVMKYLMPGEAYEYWVVAHNSAGEAQSAHKVFIAPLAPKIEAESVSGVISNDATLEAKIDPQGQAVDYQFQLVAGASEYPSELECPQRSLPVACPQTSSQGETLPIGYLPADSSDQSVSLDLSYAGVTLKPDVTYHYRVVVAPFVLSEDTVGWEGPSAQGADQTFTTLEEPVVPPESSTTSTGDSSKAGPSGGASSGTGSQGPGTSSTLSTIGYTAADVVTPDRVPPGKMAVKDHPKRKRLVKRKKARHHKSKASKRKDHTARR